MKVDLLFNSWFHLSNAICAALLSLKASVAFRLRLTEIGVQRAASLCSRKERHVVRGFSVFGFDYPLRYISFCTVQQITSCVLYANFSSLAIKLGNMPKSIISSTFCCNLLIFCVLIFGDTLVPIILRFSMRQVKRDWG